MYQCILVIAYHLILLHDIFYSLNFFLSLVGLSSLLSTTSGSTHATFLDLSNIDPLVSY